VDSTQYINKLYMTEQDKSRENYTRVTQILFPFSGLQSIPQEILQNAAERGTRVHQICEGIVSGIGEIGVDDETWGFVESFKKWWNEERTVEAIEKRFWDDELRITGQVDFILKEQHGFTIYDIKTSSRPSKTWQAQGSAYAYLAKKSGYPITKVIFIHLNKHGKEPKLHEYPVDDTFFLSIQRVYKHFFYKE